MLTTKILYLIAGLLTGIPILLALLYLVAPHYFGQAIGDGAYILPEAGDLSTIVALILLNWSFLTGLVFLHHALRKHMK